MSKVLFVETLDTVLDVYGKSFTFKDDSDNKVTCMASLVLNTIRHDALKPGYYILGNGVVWKMSFGKLAVDFVPAIGDSLKEEEVMEWFEECKPFDLECKSDNPHVSGRFEECQALYVPQTVDYKDNKFTRG